MRALAWAMTVALLGACSTEDRGSPGHSAPQDVLSEDVPTAAATFAESPLFSLGGVDEVGPTQFSWIIALDVASDGSLWVADAQSLDIRVFSAEGRHLFTVGGRGEGPGEFQDLRFVGAHPDGSVLAVDGRTLRVTRFGVDGELRQTQRWSVPSMVLPIGISAAGSLVGLTFPAIPAAVFGDPEGTYTDTAAVLRWIDPSTEPDTVARPAAITSVVSRDGAQVVPFTRMPAVGVADNVYVSSGPNFEIDVLASDGSRGRIAVDRDPRPVSSVVGDFREYVRVTSPPEIAGQRIALLDHPALPEFLPAYATIIPTPGGEVWASHSSVDPSAATTWDVFAGDGQFLGQVVSPDGFAIYSIDGDIVTGVTRDEFGVPYLQRWAISRN